MGKGKGKKGRKEEKAAARAEKRAKVAASTSSPVVKPAKPEKAPKVKKTPREDPKTTATTPTDSSSKLFMRPSQHAKWQSLFKKNLGLIEMHIKTLDRVMQGMKSEMLVLPEGEKLLWQLGEHGNWRLICGMMDRAREVLASTREIAKGVLPPDVLRHKKGLGVVGTTFEPLEPELAQRAAATGFDQKTGRATKADESSSSEDSDGDTEMSDSSSDSSSESGSDSDSDSESTPGTGAAAAKGFVPLAVAGKKRKADSPEPETKAKKRVSKGPAEVEENPYFVIDLEPSPVNLNGGHATKKAKKDKSSTKKDKKAKDTPEKPSTDGEAEAASKLQAQVDFAAIQAQLQAEVAAGLKKQAEREVEDESKKSKKEKKKRKRDSIGGEGVVEVKKVR